MTKFLGSDADLAAFEKRAERIFQKATRGRSPSALKSGFSELGQLLGTIDRLSHYGSQATRYARSLQLELADRYQDATGKRLAL